MLPTRGRPAAPMMFEVVRELSAADIYRATTEPEAAPHSAVPAVQVISARHRLTAQLIARGTLTDIEVAAAVGMTPQRVHQLKSSDPAFRELIAYYSDQIESANIEDAQRINGKLLALGEIMLDSLLDAAEEDPRRISIAERRQILQMALDRTTSPPKQAQSAEPAPTKITFNIAGRGLAPRDVSVDVEPIVIDNESKG